MANIVKKAVLGATLAATALTAAAPASSTWAPSPSPSLVPTSGAIGRSLDPGEAAHPPTPPGPSSGRPDGGWWTACGAALDVA